MDRRTSPRAENIRPVHLVILGEQETSLQVMLQDLSEGGARIKTPFEIKSSTPVRLDVDDSILLGETVYCAPQEDGYVIGLQFEQCLGRVSDLKRLVNALMGPSQPRPVSQSR